jgi:hypothetical protein
MQPTYPNGTIEDHLRCVGSTRVRYGFHATVVDAEKVENDTAQWPSYQSKVGSTMNIAAIDQGSSEDVSVAHRWPSSTSSRSASGTPTARPARPAEIVHESTKTRLKFDLES